MTPVPWTLWKRERHGGIVMKWYDAHVGTKTWCLFTGQDVDDPEAVTAQVFAVDARGRYLDGPLHEWTTTPGTVEAEAADHVRSAS